MAERIPNFSTPGFPCLTEHAARWIMWYMICTSGYDLEQRVLTSKLAVLWLQGWARCPQTILPALTLRACTSTQLAQASHLSFIISRNQFMRSFLYLTVMPMQALVSAVWPRPEAELTHTVFPGWHLNPMGFKRCSVNFYIHTKKEREVIICFHVITLSFTFSRAFWKLCLDASGFTGVLWLSLFNFSSWAQSIPHILLHY